MFRKILLFLIVFLFSSQALSQTKNDNISPIKEKASKKDYIVQKPGEITFTSGVVIEGRVEKPQLMLVITKEELRINPISFKKKFTKNITNSLKLKASDLYKIKTDDAKESGFR